MGPSNIAFQLNFFSTAGDGVAGAVGWFFFRQIHKGTAVHTNIQGLACSTEVRQIPARKGEMTTAANSACDRCNTSLTAGFKVIVMKKD
jgi:hypothetical protein